MFEENRYPWSGDHCSNDALQTNGVFLSNRARPAGTSPGLEDIAATVCALFDVPAPEGSEGRDLFAE